MNKKKILTDILLLLIMTFFAGCFETCLEHVDENNDFLCDKCFEELAKECLNHCDENLDNICDVCNEKIEEIIEKYTFDFETYNKELNERRDYLFEFMWAKCRNYTTGKMGFSISAAFIKMYEETSNQEYFDKAMEMTLKCYQNVEKTADCFNICYAAYHYGLFNELYTPELKEYAKKVFTTATVYGDRPSTTNHALMFAVGTYLANQYFPGEIKTEYYGYDAVQTDDPTAEKTIREIIELYPITGVYEYNSTTYFPSHFLPLLAIAECSNDEVLAKKALMVVHNSIFTFAPVWLKGHIAVGNERNYQPYTSENEGGVTNTLLWYYFGGRDEFPTHEQLIQAESAYIGFALHSDFLPHWISVAMSEDREEIYEHYETHLYTKDRWNNTYTFFMNTYMHQDYAVFSTRDTVTKINGHTGLYEYVACLRGFDRDIWGVDWTCENPNEKSNFSICNWDAPVTDAHTKIGNTPYSQVLHDKGTVIGVFDIPSEYDSRYPDYTYPRYLTINMPTNYKMLINESYKGEMYVHYGNLLIGYKLSLPFIYLNEDHTYTDDVTKAWFVCEVMDSDDCEGESIEEQLYYFQSLCQASFRTIEADLSGRIKISYTAINGTTLSLQYGGDEAPTNGIINGVDQIYDTNNWPSQLNPWTNTSYGEKIIVYTYKGNKFIFDFNNWTTNYEVNYD